MRMLVGGALAVAVATGVLGCSSGGDSAAGVDAAAVADAPLAMNGG